MKNNCNYACRFILKMYKDFKYHSLIALLFVLIPNSLSAESNQANLSVNLKNTSIKNVFKNIEKNSNYVFYYSDQVKPELDKIVDITSTSQSINKILDIVFKNTTLAYSVEGYQVSVSVDKTNKQDVAKANIKTADKTIKGTVVDQNGEPVIGASILVEGTTTGTATDFDGAFTLDAPIGSTMLVSYLGYASQKINITNQSDINIKLIEDSKLMDEIVVTALGIKRDEKSLGYSVQKISGAAVQAVKGTNIAEGLTGKVAGLTIKNSTELLDDPVMKLRGGDPLVVIDDVAYGNLKMKDLNPDDIEDFNILKGATASALYGARGQYGAIMITTKKGKSGRLIVDASNNTMFKAGFLKIPKPQTSYASGQLSSDGNRLLYDKDFVWGPYMDGRMVEQYNGQTKQYESMPLIARGKDNLSNFLENSYVTTTTASVSQATDQGSFRIGLNHAYTKGQYETTSLTKYGVSGSGTIKFDKFTASANFSLTRRSSPNLPDVVKYGGGNIIYNMVIWTGADYDVRDFKDYWKAKDQTQNWPWSSWYDNPYYLVNERKYILDENIASGSVNLSYDFDKKLKIQLRSGLDQYSKKEKTRQAMGGHSVKNGYFGMKSPSGWSFSNDLIAQSELKYNDFRFDLLAGMGSYYKMGYTMDANTEGGINVPGFYSLNASVNPATVKSGEESLLNYSVYGKATISYKSMAYLDITGRNDWSSTLSKDKRSFFYPSVGLSFLPTELYNPVENVLDFLKLRTAWTVSKTTPKIYETNMYYDVSSNIWGNSSTGQYPTTLSDPTKIDPVTLNSFEFGLDMRFLKGRLSFDWTYFRNRLYNRTVLAPVSEASGFKKVLVNTDEDRIQKGMEFTVRGTIIQNRNFTWSSSFNLGFDHWYYNKFDPIYSSQDPYYKKGKRADGYRTSLYSRDPQGNMIYSNGLTTRDGYSSLLGNEDAKFMFGFTNQFKIGRFDVSMSIDGRVGGLMFAQTNQAMWNTGAHPDSDNALRYADVVLGEKYIAPGVKVVSGTLLTDNYGKVISDTRVFATNDVGVSYSTFIKDYAGNAYTARPQNEVDPTFIKMRELAVNYTLPANVANKIGCSNAIVGLIGQNLFIWTKSKEFKYSDPDRGRDALNSPSVRLIGFNVNLTF